MIKYSPDLINFFCSSKGVGNSSNFVWSMVRNALILPSTSLYTAGREKIIFIKIILLK